MALDRDELNRRRRAREAQRRKRERAQRMMLIRLIAAMLILAVSGVAIFLMSRDKQPEQETLSTGGAQAETSAPETSPEETADATEETVDPVAAREKEDAVIHIAAAGDLNVTDKTVWAGQNEGGYDYTNVFMDVAPVFSKADLAILNFEGIVSGIPYGSAKNSAPAEMLQALKNAGVDMLQVANSCSVNNGISGLEASLASIRAAGLEPVGAFADAEEFKKTKGYTIVNVGEVKLAFIAFTKGMNGRGLPAGSEDCVNLLYTDYSSEYQEVDKDGIKKILQSAQAESPDLTIVMLHWGSEHNDTLSNTQKSITELLLDNGVDVILGTHPHFVHEITYDEVTGQLVAYSLGDFFGDAERNGTQYSIILDLEITKDFEAGVTKVTDYSYTPIYTLSDDDSAGGHRVVRIENAMSAYEMNYIDKVTDSCYSDMEYALQRIRDRLKGKYN